MDGGMDGAQRGSMRADRFLPRIRVAARATGVATVFALSAMAGFGTEPPATRPALVAKDFTPRPYAMSYAVREAVAQARAGRQFAGVLEALEARRTPATIEAPALSIASSVTTASASVSAYGGTAEADDRAAALDRFDAFVAGTLALDVSATPIPTMRPITRTVGPGASSP